MSYPFSGFSFRYEVDVVRMLSSGNWFGPPPTIGCTWPTIQGMAHSHHDKTTIGRYLVKRHGSFGRDSEWKSLWRDQRIFASLDLRIPVEDPERPVRKQAPPKPINIAGIREWCRKNNMPWE